MATYVNPSVSQLNYPKENCGTVLHRNARQSVDLVRDFVAALSPFSTRRKAQANDFLDSTPIRMLLKPDHPLMPLVDEEITMASLIEIISQQKNSIVPISRNGAPFTTFNVMQIVNFCLRETGSNCPIEGSDAALLKSKLMSTKVKEVIEGDEVKSWVSLPASASLRDLIRILLQQNEVVIVDNASNPLAILTREEVIDFLYHSREKIAYKLKQKVSEINVENREKRRVSATLQTFQVLWGKHLNGMIAASKLCTSVDCFLTWVKYAATIDQEDDILEEPEVISDEETLKYLLDLFARRKTVRWVLVKDKATRNIRGCLTRKDLLNFMLIGK